MMVLELGDGPCLVVVAVFVVGDGAVDIAVVGVGLLRRIAFVGFVVVGVAVVRMCVAGAVVAVWVVPAEVVVAVGAVDGAVGYSVDDIVAVAVVAAVAAVAAVAVIVSEAAALGVFGVAVFEAFGVEFAALVVESVVVIPPKTFVASAVVRFGAH